LILLTFLFSSAITSETHWNRSDVNCFNEEFAGLINQLLDKNREKRLDPTGAKAIKAHPYFTVGIELLLKIRILLIFYFSNNYNIFFRRESTGMI